jgi:hypothetical protein
MFGSAGCSLLRADGFSIKPWIRIQIGNQPKMLDPVPESMNPDPKHWSLIDISF